MKKISRLTLKKPKHLTQVKEKAFFKAMQAVVSARGSEENSMFSLDHIQVKDGKISASDGHRLCVAEIPDYLNHLIDGYYLPLKIKKTVVDIIHNPDFKGNFPEVEQIEKISDYKEGEFSTFTLEDYGSRYKSCNLSANYCRLCRELSADSVINIDLFKDYIDFDHVIVPKHESGIVKVCDSGVTVYIMPI